jgi:hypothetical protein
MSERPSIRRKSKKKQKELEQTEESETEKKELTEEEMAQQQRDEENKNGFIPIVVITCKEFEFPDIAQPNDEMDENGNTPDVNAKCAYLVDHFKRCNNCEMTNNNNREFSTLINTDCTMSYQTLSESSIECKLALESYYSCQKYDPFGGCIDKLTCKIFHINDTDSIYNGQLLIAIAQPESS